MHASSVPQNPQRNLDLRESVRFQEEAISFPGKIIVAVEKTTRSQARN
jgi:hypothetical protein